MSSNTPLSRQESEAARFIRNSLMHKGAAPSLRDLMPLLGYKSANSVMLIINQLINKGYLKRRPDGRLQLIQDPHADESNAKTIAVPLVGSAPCGQPMLAEENIEMFVPVSTKLIKPNHKYFLLRAIGDSMNEKGIESGDVVLVQQQQTAESGQTVVALIDDEATIKEYHPSEHTIVLKPRSRNKKHSPILLDKDFQIQGIVTTTISGI